MNEPRTNSRLFAFLSVLLQDSAFSIRQLKKSPAFAAIVAGSLALGIGASVTVFSVVRAVLLDPYPYKDADRMIHVELTSKDASRNGLLMVTYPEYQQLRQVSSIDDVFLMDDQVRALTGDALPVTVETGFYTANLFTYMGVPPFLGRQFTPADAPRGKAAPVTVLSYLFWKKQYGGRLDILGKTVEIDHSPYSVIGVASPRFTWGDSDVYIPGGFTSDPHHYMNAFIKLKPGTKFSKVASELQPLVDGFARLDPARFPPNPKVVIKTLNEEVMNGFELPLLMLFASVLLLLLIGCANVSILMLARGASRQQEFAVRASIGASRARIVRQLLTESLMLSFVGAAIGVLMAFKGVDLLASHLPRNSFPNEAVIHVNGLVLLFAVAIALLTGIFFGGSPAWQLSSPDVGALMQSSSGKLAGTIRGRHTHRLLIAGQVALTMLMLAGAGAAIRAFLNLYHAPMGFDPDHLVYMQVSLPKTTPLEWHTLQVQQESLREAIEAAPGIKSASITTTGWRPRLSNYKAKIEVSNNPNFTNAQADLALLSFNSFKTLQTPLHSGRYFTREEDARAAHVALVNRSFVHQYFANGDAVGKSVRSAGLRFENPNLTFTANSDGWFQVVGVVDDIRNDGLDKPVLPAMYVPESVVLGRNTVFLVRASGVSAVSMRAAGESLHRANADAYIIDQHEFSWLLENQAWGREKFLASLFGIFASLALALSAAGIYSVVSYTVSQRTREFGVRMALGARRNNVVRLVLQSSLLTVTIGAGIGLTLSIALGRLLSSATRGIVRDPLMLLLVSAILLLITMASSLFPALRAASIDPIEAIRAE